MTISQSANYSYDREREKDREGMRELGRWRVRETWVEKGRQKKEREGEGVNE